MKFVEKKNIRGRGGERYYHVSKIAFKNNFIKNYTQKKPTYATVENHEEDTFFMTDFS